MMTPSQIVETLIEKGIVNVENKEFVLSLLKNKYRYNSKTYYEKYKDKKLSKMKEYNELHKDKIKEYNKQYYDKIKQLRESNKV